MTAASPHRLTVVPLGGIGNRMRVIRSAYAVARLGVCRVDVAFASLRNCRCRFSDLFQPLPSPPPGFRIHSASFCDKPALRRNLYIPSLLRRFRYDAALYGFNSSGDEKILDFIGKFPRLYISGGYEFAGEDIPMSELFRPSPAVQKILDKLLARFGSYTVGFHVRTTDNRESMRLSPLGLFLEKGREELAQHPDATFFVATDSVAVKRAFVTTFPGRVVTLGGSLSRSERSGMIIAAADMFALSHADKVYGSWYSSFSEIAAELGGKRAEILKLR